MSSIILALDIGDKRIGMAVADDEVKIPRVLPTIEVDDQVFDKITEIITYEGVETVVVGYPRNLSGEPTPQTDKVIAFVNHFSHLVDVPFVYQDESLTSVRAEEMLRARGKAYTKPDIDAEAASIILRDYLELL